MFRTNHSMIDTKAAVNAVLCDLWTDILTSDGRVDENSDQNRILKHFYKF